MAGDLRTTSHHLAMSYTNQITRYTENEILTRAPEWLVPLLYERLHSALTRASVQLEIRDLEGKANSLGTASAILGELIATLDEERGGEIARSLRSLYAYFSLEILNIGRSNDRKLLDQLTGMIGELHEAWVQAAEQVAPRGRGRATAMPAA
jgi:flagellar secretion chaperone FliS